MILQFPFFQLGLHLVQNHGQLSQDLLQVIHVVVVQDFCLEVSEQTAREAEQLKRDLLPGLILRLSLTMSFFCLDKYGSVS